MLDASALAAFVSSVMCIAHHDLLEERDPAQDVDKGRPRNGSRPRKGASTPLSDLPPDCRAHARTKAIE